MQLVCDIIASAAALLAALLFVGSLMSTIVSAIMYRSYPNGSEAFDNKADHFVPKLFYIGIALLALAAIVWEVGKGVSDLQMLNH